LRFGWKTETPLDRCPFHTYFESRHRSLLRNGRAGELTKGSCNSKLVRIVKMPNVAYLRDSSRLSSISIGPRLSATLPSRRSRHLWVSQIDSVSSNDDLTCMIPFSRFNALSKLTMSDTLPRTSRAHRQCASSMCAWREERIDCLW
jgi:hypothetical protein